MKSLITYGSQYGTTKRYAEKLAQMTGIPVASYEDIKELAGYELVIHFGGLYAGGVRGLKRIIKLLPQTAKFIIVTVGLADVSDEKNVSNIKNALKRQVPEDILKNAFIFHLRGGTPTLALIVERESKISTLKKEKFYTVEIGDGNIMCLLRIFLLLISFSTSLSLAAISSKPLRSLAAFCSNSSYESILCSVKKFIVLDACFKLLSLAQWLPPCSAVP